MVLTSFSLLSPPGLEFAGIIRHAPLYLTENIKKLFILLLLDYVGQWAVKDPLGASHASFTHDQGVTGDT